MKPFTLADAQIEQDVPKPISVPGLDDLDDAHLPDIPLPYHAPEVLRPLPETSTFDASHQLTDLVDLSLQEARKLIETEWDFSDPRLVSSKASMIQTIFSTQNKVDVTRLRARQTDMLPKLLAELARAEKTVPPRLIEG